MLLFQKSEKFQKKLGKHFCMIWNWTRDYSSYGLGELLVFEIGKRWSLINYNKSETYITYIYIHILQVKATEALWREAFLKLYLPEMYDHPAYNNVGLSLVTSPIKDPFLKSVMWDDQLSNAKSTIYCLLDIS